MPTVGWKTRIGLVVSAIWVVAVYALAANERNSSTVFLLLGVAPIALLWGAIWVIRGYRAEKPAPIPRAPDPRRKGAWTRRAVGLVLLSAGLIAVSYFSQKAGYGSERLGYLFGYYIWGLLLVWAIWVSAFKRLPGGFLLLTGLMYASAATWESVKFDREFTEGNNFAKYGSALLARSIAGESVSYDDIRNAKLGRLEPLLVVMTDFISSSTAAQRKFQAVADNSHVDTLLSPATLATSEGLSEAEMRLAAVKLALEQSLSEYRQVRQRFEIDLKALDVPGNAKQAVLAGYQKSPAFDDGAIAEYYEIEESTMKSMSDLIAFLKSRQGHYILGDKRLLFSNQQDLATYNQYIESVLQGAVREASWQRGMQERSNSKLKALSNMAK